MLIANDFILFFSIEQIPNACTHRGCVPSCFILLNWTERSSCDLDRASTRAEGRVAGGGGVCGGSTVGRKKKIALGGFGVTLNPAYHKCMGCPGSFFPPRCTAPKPITCVGLLFGLAGWRVGLPPHGSPLQPVNIMSTGMTPREDGIFASVCREECGEFQKKKEKKSQSSSRACGCRRGTISLHFASFEEPVCHTVTLTTYAGHRTPADCSHSLRLDVSGCCRSSALNCTRPPSALYPIVICQLCLKLDGTQCTASDATLSALADDKIVMPQSDVASKWKCGCMFFF